MIALKELFRKAYPGATAVRSLPDLSVSGIECDSRRVKPGFLFIAIRGAKDDGRKYIQDAIRNGAAAVASAGTDPAVSGVPHILLDDDRDAAARFAAAWYDFPAEKLRLIGVTGTNGKTTCTYLLEHFLSVQGEKTGVIGTVNYRYAGKVIPAVETTPGPLSLQSLFAEMREAGVRTVAMEVSAHALDQGRTAGLRFETALFTNLTQDHLDYFGTMDKYFRAKARLFEGLGPAATAVLNADDAAADKLRRSNGARCLSYGVSSPADLRAVNIRYDKDRTHFGLETGGVTLGVDSPLVGLHNVYNVLGAFAVMRALGFDVSRAARSLADFRGVPGRLEPVNCGQNFSVYIDYAHTPDGLENVLASLIPYKKGRLFVVFGCGGDRDRAKRPQMGRIASALSDHVFVTSDNPRSEKPESIAEEIRAGFREGFTNYSVVVDRRKAIRQALLAARENDIIVLAGKGHETTQVIGGQALPFSEREEAERVLSGH